ncbi:SRPBCC family protein [Sphingomonas cavernae]|uniref:SRPBCC domain-containing protein n=1 Tax=Sphingomonas cavernae TaxID=2320861 RepID=A0A418W8A5_9SPHN|nr:SRPBCC domain-containing protein [Sphingomonas cavernae]RJF86232.1 SRPBCC domain-containing protein [Sphingomonas cavernae]
MKLFLLAIAGLAIATPAAAEVKSASDGGFEVVSVETVKATPAAAYDALRNPGQWWNGEHSYSGDAKNMTIDARAGGCFCERTPGGGTIEHGRIIYAQPGKVLRFVGGLGPLQSEAITATMTWTIEPAPGGAKITQRYVASGYMPGGLKGIAPVVDKVLAEQLGRLKVILDKPAG